MDIVDTAGEKQQKEVGGTASARSENRSNEQIVPKSLDDTAPAAGSGIDSTHLPGVTSARQITKTKPSRTYGHNLAGGVRSVLEVLPQCEKQGVPGEGLVTVPPKEHEADRQSELASSQSALISVPETLVDAHPLDQLLATEAMARRQSGTVRGKDSEDASMMRRASKPTLSRRK
jgi:hypothetical protein